MILVETKCPGCGKLSEVQPPDGMDLDSWVRTAVRHGVLCQECVQKGWWYE